MKKSINMISEGVLISCTYSPITMECSKTTKTSATCSKQSRSSNPSL